MSHSQSVPEHLLLQKSRRLLRSMGLSGSMLDYASLVVAGTWSVIFRIQTLGP